MGRSFESAGTAGEPEKKSRKLYLLPILLLLLIAICGIGFSLTAKGGEEPAAEVSGGSGEAVTADEMVPPPVSEPAIEEPEEAPAVIEEAEAEDEPEAIEVPAAIASPVYIEFDENGVEGSITADDGHGVIAYSGVGDEEAADFLKEEAEKYGLTGFNYTVHGNTIDLTYPEGYSYEERERGAETLIEDLGAYTRAIPVIIPAGPVIIEEPEPVIIDEPEPVIIEEETSVEEAIAEPEIIEEEVTTEEAIEEPASEEIIAEPAVIEEEPAEVRLVYIPYSVDGVEGSITADDGYGVIAYSGVDEETAKAFLDAEAEKYGVTGVTYSITPTRAELFYAKGYSYEAREEAAETLIEDMKSYMVVVPEEDEEVLPALPAAIIPVAEEEVEEEKGIHSVSLGFSPWAYQYYDFYNAPVTDKDEFETGYGFAFMASYEARVLSFLAVGVETGYSGYYPQRSIIPSDSYYWSVPVLAKAAVLIGNEGFDFRIGAHAGVDITKLNADMSAYFMFGIDFGFDFHLTDDVSVFWRVRNSMTLQPHPGMEILSSNTFMVHPAIIGVTYHI